MMKKILVDRYCPYFYCHIVSCIRSFVEAEGGEENKANDVVKIDASL